MVAAARVFYLVALAESFFLCVATVTDFFFRVVAAVEALTTLFCSRGGGCEILLISFCQGGLFLQCQFVFTFFPALDTGEKNFLQFPPGTR